MRTKSILKERRLYNLYIHKNILKWKWHLPLVNFTYTFTFAYRSRIVHAILSINQNNFTNQKSSTKSPKCIRSFVPRARNCRKSRIRVPKQIRLLSQRHNKAARAGPPASLESSTSLYPSTIITLPIFPIQLALTLLSRQGRRKNPTNNPDLSRI